MTLEEKTDELISRFRGFGMPNENISSIQCAIICVDEIMDTIKTLMSVIDVGKLGVKENIVHINLSISAKKEFNYYQEVKRILENKLK